MRRFARIPLAAMILLGLITAACGGSAVATGPPDINYGRDVCFECGMIISEERFASAYRLADGTEKIFDDVGGMLQHGHETGEIRDAEAWVHDYETEEWIRAESGYYIITQRITTPMAFGVIAFGDQARAAAFGRDVDGDVVGWDTVLELPPGDLITIGSHSHDDDQKTSAETSSDELDHEKGEAHE